MTLRIGCPIGYWGDDVSAPRRMVEDGGVDIIVMDFLAEVTMSILRKQMARDLNHGFPQDAVQIIADLVPDLRAKNIRVVTNAGGMNPSGCIAAIVANSAASSTGLRLAAVAGDDVLSRIPELAAGGGLVNMDDGRPFSAIEDAVTSANVYLGADGLVTGLRTGAQVVVSGRTTDTALVLAPLIEHYGWLDDDWDRLAAGIVAGHLIECSSQVTGGFHQSDWQSVPGLDLVGSPIVEVEEDGSFVVTKAPGTGGVVNRETVTEQLLYEIQDPRLFQTPDVTVDFTSIQLSEAGPDRVLVRGVRGSPPPETLKVSITYSDGWATTLLWPYAQPRPVAKAEATIRRTLASIERLGLSFEEVRTDIFGAGAIMGDRAQIADGFEPVEVLARVAARSRSRQDVERLSMELAPAYFSPPGLAGFIAGGRGRVTQLISHWPALMPGDGVEPEVTVL